MERTCQRLRLSVYCKSRYPGTDYVPTHSLSLPVSTDFSTVLLAKLLCKDVLCLRFVLWLEEFLEIFQQLKYFEKVM